jgi:peptidyl-prolyl cis-trans isomerase SurA
MKVYRSVAAVCVATALAASAWAQSGLRPAQPMQPAPSKAQQPAAAQPAAAQPAAASAATRRAAPRSGAVDYIVAVVNDEVITRAELDVKLEIAERQVRQQGTTLPRNVLERQVLERVIAERVQEQQAKTIGLTVEDTQVDRAIQRIAEQNNLSLNDFRDRLEKDGIPFERFRRDVRQEILFVRLREREVDNRIQVSEGEIDNFLAERAGAPTGGVEISLAQILVRVPEGSSPEVIARQRAKAEDMVRQLRGGADFAKMAVAFSDSPDALKGGEMGFRIQERWPQLFLEAIRDLQPGGVSNLVQSPAGFHILKLVNKRAAAQPAGAGPAAGAAQTLATAPVQQTRARHILIRVNELISTQEAQRRLTDVRQRIANGTKFEDMAKQYSVDGNAAQGGDLGWLYPGDAVPEFQRVMDSLKPGEISQPVETNFGWHLIQVLERRTQDVSSERQRLVARQALRERKADDAYDDWLRQLRDRAYVEIRLENPNT